MKRVDTFKQFTKERERHDRDAMQLPRPDQAKGAETGTDVRTSLTTASTFQAQAKKRIIDND